MKRGLGAQGNSYALPTKDTRLRTLPLYRVGHYVETFLKEATKRHTLQFQVTRIGCGLAGLKDEAVAPMFMDAPDNCFFDEAWKPWLGSKHKYWGSF